MIVMSQPSYLKFFSRIKKGGQALINTSLVRDESPRDDIEMIEVPANEIAQEIGNSGVANMVALGAWVKKSKVVSLESLVESFPGVISSTRLNLLPLNEKALREGARFVS